MNTLYKILGFTLIAYCLFEIGLRIVNDIETSAYWRGVEEARARCYQAHGKKLKELMDERMKRDIAVAERKFK